MRKIEDPEQRDKEKLGSVKFEEEEIEGQQSVGLKRLFLKRSQLVW